MLKKLYLFLCLALFLGAQDFYSLVEEIIDLNKQVQNQTSTQVLVQTAQEKTALMKQIATSIANNRILPYSKLDQSIANLKSALANTQQIQNPYSLAVNTLELNALLAKKELLQCAEMLSEKNNFFTTHTEIKDKINKTINQIKHYNNIPTDKITKNEIQDFKSKQNRFDIVLGSYVEILTFLENNTKLLLPESFWSNFDLAWLLDKITHFMPQKLQHIALAKALLSLLIFSFFFFLRNIIVHFMLKAISTLSLFLKSKDIQDQIKKQIAKPVLWLVVIVSLTFSLDILTYPNPVSPKLKIWINAGLIISLSWLTILLFKGYGIAILGSLAQRNNTFRREVINLLLKVLYFLIVLIAVLSLLKNFGFNISALIASLGIGGLAVAFAIKDMLANFFASVVLLFDNSFNQGDWIVCGDIEGNVVEIGLRRTTIRTFDNAMLFVPNSLLANGSVRNWNRRKRGRRIKFDVGLTYDSTPDQIRACIHDIQTMLINHPQIAKEGDDRQPLSHYELDLKSNIVSLDDLLGYKCNLFVVLEEFADSSINILIYCFSKTTNWGEWLDVRQDVMLKVMDILNAHNLSFAFPSQSLYIEKMPSQDKIKNT